MLNANADQETPDAHTIKLSLLISLPLRAPGGGEGGSLGYLNWKTRATTAVPNVRNGRLVLKSQPEITLLVPFKKKKKKKRTGYK